MRKFFYPLAIVTAIVYVVLFLNLKSNWVLNLDQHISDLLKGNQFIEFFHYFGEPAFVGVVASILVLVLWIKDHNYRGMFFALVTIAAGNVLNQLLKVWVQRPRPDIPDQIKSFSFPSGHSMTGILYLFTLAYIATEYQQSKKVKVFTWIGAITMTILIGMSRVAGSRHFATDVLAGWSMGYTWFIIAVIWYERRKRLYKKLAQEKAVE
ncbi:phosphatase PAP2 family protein [Viridibacillus sp. YIM B01967]|uniref:Phosphatase PAP2 family protein n=1 Tax=Viridibacillus soli TaxID=2798301 RepID=A0ABS1H591_9BACL|nr:phosphatase PAP2 family protein [Viridibacillus soli]MBK3494585.1 phosphatase PAP2 family protein [Viridibacillus soli]